MHSYKGRGCTDNAAPVEGTQQCETIETGTRCQLSCSGSGHLTLATPSYYTCSMYGMWDEPDRLVDFLYPSCGGKK